MKNNLNRWKWKKQKQPKSPLHLLAHRHLYRPKPQVVNQKFGRVRVVTVVNVRRRKRKQPHQCLVKSRQLPMKERVARLQQDRNHRRQHHRRRQLFKDDQAIVERRKTYAIVNAVFQVEVMKKKLKTTTRMKMKTMRMILLRRYDPISSQSFFFDSMASL